MGDEAGVGDDDAGAVLPAEDDGVVRGDEDAGQVPYLDDDGGHVTADGGGDEVPDGGAC